MSSDLMPRQYGQPEERRGLLARASRAERAIQQRAELDLLQLASDARHDEVKAILRKRLTECGMEDITDVGREARELADGDQFIASLLIPIVQEFARQTAHDVRDFGRGHHRS